MSSGQTLNCFRCEKTATVFIPESNRVLCDVHLATFKEARENLSFSSVEINDQNVAAVLELLPKEATHVDELSMGVDDDHRVPVSLIVDHLAELKTGTEPATCKVCGKPMQLHAQFATTKQTDTTAPSLTGLEATSKKKVAALEQKVFEALLHPNYLSQFEGGGTGSCLRCGGSGMRLIDRVGGEAGGSSVKQMLAHMNDAKHGQGHYSQVADHPVLGKIDQQAAIKGNIPVFMHPRTGNIVPNRSYNPEEITTFPFSTGLRDYGQFNFGQVRSEKTGKPGHPIAAFHTFLTALEDLEKSGIHPAERPADDFSPAPPVTGEPLEDPGHGHVETIENLTSPDHPGVVSPFCRSCLGEGQHPLINDEDVRATITESTIKATETPRRPQSSVEIRVGHSGPGIKPHDHHNKPHTYQKRDQAPGSPTPKPKNDAGSNMVPKKPRGPKQPGGKSKGPRLKMPKGPAGLGPKSKIQSLLERFPVEKWIYEISNAMHDMTHTVYKNPSYMYRNPNPMYYSVPRGQWGMAKPWRN